MAPKSVLVQNQNKSKNNMFLKKLNHCLVVNTNLRNRIKELLTQNKQLSINRNNLLLVKLSLQNENNSIKNANIQLTAMHNIMVKKLSLLEQTIKSCIPALVTMSQCIPSMLENVHEMSKSKVKDLNKKKEEKQTNTVRPMVNGMTITQPAVSIRRFDMSPIIESPSSSSEQTPKRPRKLSYRSSPQCKLNMESYVRLKDVAAMLKNSKAVNNKSPTREQNKSLGEGQSKLHTQKNQIRNSINIVQNSNSYPKSSTPIGVQADVTTIASMSNGNMDNTIIETEVCRSDIISHIDSSMMRNITQRKRYTRSNESSNVLDIDDSTSSSRPSRSATKSINYKEKSIKDKLRR